MANRGEYKGPTAVSDVCTQIGSSKCLQLAGLRLAEESVGGSRQVENERSALARQGLSRRSSGKPIREAAKP
jgi:hypothetical protein